jgi:hypothetical protein
MKVLFLIPLSAVWLAAAEPAPAQPLAVPAGAVRTAPAAYQYTDAQGNRWIYHTSPFGVTREPEGAPPRFVRDFATVKAVEDGDSVRFERPTPFGTLRWKTAKSDLNEMERAVWNREQAARAGSIAAQE